MNATFHYEIIKGPQNYDVAHVNLVARLSATDYSPAQKHQGKDLIVKKLADAKIAYGREAYIRNLASDGDWVYLREGNVEIASSESHVDSIIRGSTEIFADDLVGKLKKAGFIQGIPKAADPLIDS